MVKVEEGWYVNSRQRRTDYQQGESKGSIFCNDYFNRLENYLDNTIANPSLLTITLVTLILLIATTIEASSISSANMINTPKRDKG